MPSPVTPSSPSSPPLTVRHRLVLMACALTLAGLTPMACDDEGAIAFCDTDADCLPGRSCVQGLCAYPADTAGTTDVTVGDTDADDTTQSPDDALLDLADTDDGADTTVDTSTDTTGADTHTDMSDTLSERCGDGAVDLDEHCDTAIPQGQPGACPTTCTALDACQPLVLEGSGCLVRCVADSPVTVCRNGDGCCAPGCTALDDDDCAPVCGNGALEPGEACDTGIGSGPGACPVSCTAPDACDIATPVGTGCDVTCMVIGSITTCTDGDGCCAPGCSSANDDDCAPDCGNGRLDPGETCDLAIPVGSGACPTVATCVPLDICENAQLSGAGTCSATCALTTTTACLNGDGCCPSGCNATTDDDCTSQCGNGVIEPGEGCDDGGLTPGDGCDASCQVETPSGTPTVFRFTDLTLRDPHVWVQTLTGCEDITDTPGFFGVVPSINAQLQRAIQQDTNLDGRYDLSIGAIFRPLTPTTGASPLPFEGGTIDCALPTTFGGMATCQLLGGAPALPVTTYTTLSGGSQPCLEPVSTHLGSVRNNMRSAYTPGVTVPSTSGGRVCFVTAPTTFAFNFAGTTIALQSAQLAAELTNGNTRLEDGLVIGFLSTTAAAQILIDNGQGGTIALADLLAGDPQSCRTTAGYSDLDTGPAGESGWWFHLNFPASRVTWTGP